MTVKKNVYGVAFVLLLIFSAAAGLLPVNFASADPYVPTSSLPSIRINSDGSITPDTGYISRNGNIYTLTADIVDEYGIYISCSNIVFDGAGHAIRITTARNSGIFIGNPPARVTNVTIKNIAIFTVYEAINLCNCSHCHMTGIKTSKDITFRYSGDNTITRSDIGIYIMSDSENNLISRNNITHIVTWSASNAFYKNNMLLDDNPPYISPYDYSDNSWDNGSIGNYWSDYATRYPNASEIGNTGIGDTPYVLNAGNIDRYPLMYPYDIEKDAIAFPTPEPQPSPSLEPQPEPFPTALVASISTVTIVGVIAGLLYCQKKRSRNR